ncbi:DUF5711 family protein [Sporofaciens sp. SGI.106]|uniref:DUF5711 family protein n=1 Tax=Sporofaciens sp. SGI.106 TaxID=3420568 RepID=UPI002AA08170|nr:DUF5711 family protein [Lachnoclostridium sp.]
MKKKDKENLNVIEDTEEITNIIVNRALEEFDEDDGTMEEIAERIRKHKRRFRIKVLLIISAFLFVSIGSFLLIYLQTYTEVRVVDTRKSGDSDNNNYRQFADGVLKYSRDGVALLNRKGEEVWNQPYQIKSPMVEIYKESGAIADKGGNDVVVFDKKGWRGEIHTDYPIEKIAVSARGIVSMILKNENSPKIVCYDAAGNLLVELKTSFTGTGYPMDLGISEDGKLLLVTYMCVQDGVVTSKINYYNFDGEKETSKDYEVLEEIYKDMIAPTAFFLNDSVSVVAGSNKLLFYKGKETPVLAQTVTLNKQIKSVFHSNRYVGLVLKNEGKAGYELCLYNASGKKLMSQDFTGDYSNIKIDGSQVILYDGKKCSIFSRTGIHKFEGEMSHNILEIFPMAGVNKYIVMNANGMEVVRLVK